MDYLEKIEILGRDSAVLKAELEKLDEYCVDQIYQEYTRIREVSPNVSLNEFKVENKSFNFSFTVRVNTLPYVVGASGL